MLRLAFDFIITWRETRTRPNAYGSYILLFKIRNPEIRGPLTGMLCGCAGILVASYANMVYFQFPNGILIYSCFTFVFLGPYLDKQYSEIHGLPAA